CLSILSIIPRSYVLSSLEADLQEIQQKANNKEIEDDIHETRYLFDKYGIVCVSVVELKHPMVSLNE
ncbi:unnamed protein product, partial [Rotaria sp. Silwood1]